MAVEYTLICDGCSHVIDASSRGCGDVRDTARRHGIMFRRRGKELCVHCANELPLTNEQGAKEK